MLTEHRISSLVLVLRKDGDGSIRLNILRSLEYIFLHNGDEYCWEAQDSSKLSKLTTNNNLYGLPALLLQLTERYFFRTVYQQIMRIPLVRMPKYLKRALGYCSFCTNICCASRRLLMLKKFYFDTIVFTPCL